MKYVIILLLVLSGCTFAGQANLSLSKEIDPCSYMYPFEENGNTLYTPYCSNINLNSYSPGITRLVFVIHGSALDMEYGLNTITIAANDIGETDNTLIVVPRFLEDDVFEAENYADNVLLWSTGWRQGHLSWDTELYPRPFRISSYEVADIILGNIINSGNFPNIDKVTIVGHSAGGQFVNRYSAGNKVHDAVMVPNGIQVRYIAANPAHRMYFDNKRIVAGTDNRFEVLSSDQIASCPGYNEYRYGLDGLNSYMRFYSPESLRQNFFNRNVIEFVGELDNEPDPDYICEWALQGANHYERGIIYLNHLKDHFGPQILENHDLVINPGVGHSSRGMFTSQLGKELIFWNIEKPVKPPKSTPNIRDEIILR